MKRLASFNNISLSRTIKLYTRSKIALRFIFIALIPSQAAGGLKKERLVLQESPSFFFFS